jgi:integrase/recombinase XerD
LNELLINFIEYLKNEGKAINTISAYKSDLNQFFKGIESISDITTQTVDDYKSKMLNGGISARTANRKLIAIKNFIEWMNISEIVINARVRILKIQKQEFLGAVVTPENIEKMVQAASQDNNQFAVALFCFLEMTGCRVSELLQVKVKDVGKADIEVMGKGKIRSLFPPEKLKYFLGEYTKDMDPEDYLFKNKKTGKPVTRQYVDCIIKKYAKKARVKKEKAHAHSFRHQYGIKLSEDGMLIENIAEILGHDSINTTRIYTRQGKASLINQINKSYS